MWTENIVELKKLDWKEQNIIWLQVELGLSYPARLVTERQREKSKAFEKFKKRTLGTDKNIKTQLDDRFGQDWSLKKIIKVGISFGGCKWCSHDARIIKRHRFEELY